MDVTTSNMTSPQDVMTLTVMENDVTPSVMSSDERLTTTLPYNPVNDQVLWLGVKPEYILIPCIVAGVPLLIVTCCLVKSLIKKKRAKKQEDELWIKKKKLYTSYMNHSIHKSKIKHGPAVDNNNSHSEENGESDSKHCYIHNTGKATKTGVNGINTDTGRSKRKGRHHRTQPKQSS